METILTRKLYYSRKRHIWRQRERKMYKRSYQDILQQVNLLPQDIKSKILSYYLSYGSPTAKIIQPEIINKCKNNSATIWFANVDYIHNHRTYMLQKSIGCSFDVICDLRLAIIENNIENANTTDILKQIQKNVINNINTLTKYALERVLEEEEQLLIY
jgi:hypothetical protein